MSSASANGTTGTRRIIPVRASLRLSTASTIFSPCGEKLRLSGEPARARSARLPRRCLNASGVDLVPEHPDYV
jgi:hypothetical protein